MKTIPQTLAAPARYFPVTAKPLRMQAGLLRFPVDLGNEVADRNFFQLDDEAPAYIGAKQALLEPGGSPSGPRHGLIERDPGQQRAHAAVLEWIDRTLELEHPAVGRITTAALSKYDARLRLVQEDAVVVHRDASGRDTTIMIHVYFPSGWRPERMLGQSFAAIHDPVPGFVDDARAASSMVDAMIERGPYLRFVWAVYGDGALDHHPDDGGRIAWPAAHEGFLRIERQITVPFPGVSASLFLIRTYLRRFADLDPAERGILVQAVECMPEPIRVYKGMAGHEHTILRLLRESGPVGLAPDV